MAERAASAGGRATHIIHGLSGFMYSPDLRHALTFKDEWAILPDELALLHPHLQEQIKKSGARLKDWTEREREAYKRKLEPAAEPEAKPDKRRAKAEADEAE